MKLAFCLFKYFPYGGLQRDFRAILETCLARGHEVDVYTFEWNAPALPHINLYLIEKTKLTNYLNYEMFSQRIVKLARKKDYDAIVGFNKMAGLDVYYAADPCFKALTTNFNKNLYWLNPRYYALKKLETAIFHPMSDTQVLALAETQISAYYQSYYTPRERFHLLPPWLNKNRFPGEDRLQVRAALRQAFNLLESDKLILFVGSGFKTKGLDRAIIALSSLPESLKKQVHFFIIGHDKADSFQKLAEKYGVTKQIQFLGGRDDIPRFMFSADLLLHPAYAENTGNVLLEAIVAGTPVLATAVCGFAPHIIHANAGIVLPEVFQQSDLNKALLTMLTSDDITIWRNNGLAYPERCNLNGMPEIATDIIEWSAQLPKTMPHAVSDNFFIYPALVNKFSMHDIFNDVMRLSGKVYRDLDGRKTLAFSHENKQYFAKLHQGIGWKEIWKNIFQLRLPIVSAKNEFKAIKAFENLNLKTTPVVGFGQRGLNPATRRSFLITTALEHTISLEDLVSTWKVALPPFNFKKDLILEVAKITKLMHEGGINHRDLYICHFLLDEKILNHENKILLYLIDLHRAQIRSKVPLRWQVKDLASLYYSALQAELTKRDYFRFIIKYTGLSLREALSDKYLWEEIMTKTYKLTNRAFRFEKKAEL